MKGKKSQQPTQNAHVKSRGSVSTIFDTIRYWAVNVPAGYLSAHDARLEVGERVLAKKRHKNLHHPSVKQQLYLNAAALRIQLMLNLFWNYIRVRNEGN